jgi:hypothetical protein
VVKIVDATTVETTHKLGGKLISTNSMTVSADGAMLNGKYTDYTGTKPAVAAYTEKRVGAAPAGAHAISGSWQPDKTTEGNDAFTMVTYEMGADHFSMHANGQAYSAKFDGKEYPIEGDPGHTMVMLKRVDANTVIETDKRGGKVTDEIRIAASKDGKTIELTDNDLKRGQTTTVTMDRQ